jgi:hypothetical protein
LLNPAKLSPASYHRCGLLVGAQSSYTRSYDCAHLHQEVIVVALGLYRRSMLTHSCRVAILMVRSVSSMSSQDIKSCSQCILEGLRKVSLRGAGCNIRQRSTNFHNGRPTAHNGCPLHSMDVPQNSMDVHHIRWTSHRIRWMSHKGRWTSNNWCGLVDYIQ